MVQQIYVIKRDGTRVPVLFDKITSRITKLCYKLNAVSPVLITQQIVQSVTDGMHTKELDDLARDICVSMISTHYEYDTLATRLTVSNLHKSTAKSFYNVATTLNNYINPKLKKNTPILENNVYQFIKDHRERLDSAILYDRDLLFDYFGIQTLCDKYLLKIDGVTVERPQHLFMRIACSIHLGDIEAALETYEILSQLFASHATPTMFNAGTTNGQLCSCFLQTLKHDSIKGIYKTLRDSAQISAKCGGIGLCVSNVRAKNSYICGSNGLSNGILPFIQQFDHMVRVVDQGGGKRKGVAAIYLEPWHADIFAFLDMRKNTGPESERARNLFSALWIPDLFMQRVQRDEDWCLFCPNEAPGLWDCYGEKFEQMYTDYEKQPHLIREKIKAQKLWKAICVAQTETGTPYMLYKDACNKKSNQSNLGTIHCSNLCSEIIEYSNKNEVAVCNLASLVLHRYVLKHKRLFDFEKLGQVTRMLVRNLNKIIDRTYYPIAAAERSNKRHRPIGIGVQGLQEAFVLMRYPFESPEAAQLNRMIFETIYYHACDESVELAIKYGPYETFAGSPASQGKLQPDLWNVTPQTLYDWARLRERCVKHGMRNSLLITLMPTATTANIMGSSESCEPFATNVGAKSTLAGTFPIINKYLFEDLIERNLWSTELKDQIIANDGSIQGLNEIPKDLQDLYKTVWDIKGKVIIDMSADRGAFVCQSQSLNCHMANVTYSKLSSYHFYAWEKGLKTGMYYFRTRGASSATKVTLDVEIENKRRTKYNRNNNNTSAEYTNEQEESSSRTQNKKQKSTSFNIQTDTDEQKRVQEKTKQQEDNEKTNEPQQQQQGETAQEDEITSHSKKNSRAYWDPFSPENSVISNTTKRAKITTQQNDNQKSKNEDNDNNAAFDYDNAAFDYDNNKNNYEESAPKYTTQSLESKEGEQEESQQQQQSNQKRRKSKIEFDQITKNKQSDEDGEKDINSKQVTISEELVQQKWKEMVEVCSRKNREQCEMCSS